MLLIKGHVSVFKFFLFMSILGIALSSGEGVQAQFLRNILQDNSLNTRDDRPSEDSNDELTYEEILCRDIESFPKKISEKLFTSYFECKKDLDRIENASYIDLTYRIRQDADRLDLYLSGGREIYICDGAKLSRYEHDQRKDPDWWMISRTTFSELNCPSNGILVETID